jgi:hypothetical protein
MTHRSRLLKILFPLFSFLLPLAFALPFQEPIPGLYECFIAGEDPFAAELKDAGATLELRPDKTYTLQTASASENGTFTTQSMEDESDMTQLFKSGTGIELYAESGTAAYGGMFILDRADYIHSYKIAVVSGFAARVKVQTLSLHCKLFSRNKLSSITLKIEQKKVGAFPNLLR